MVFIKLFTVLVVFTCCEINIKYINKLIMAVARGSKIVVGRHTRRQKEKIASSSSSRPIYTVLLRLIVRQFLPSIASDNLYFTAIVPHTRSFNELNNIDP